MEMGHVIAKCWLRTGALRPDAALLEAAARADESGVKAALARGADMNAVDNATGNTAVTYAIAGDRCGRFCCVRVVCREC